MVWVTWRANSSNTSHSSVQFSSIKNNNNNNNKINQNDENQNEEDEEEEKEKENQNENQNKNENEKRKKRHGNKPPNYETPSLRQARLFRELLLPRRIYDKNQPTKHRLAYPGELEDDDGNAAKLYDFFKTPSSALDEFGIGLSLYFASVKALFIVFLASALILLVAIYENRNHQDTDSTPPGDDGPYCNRLQNDTVPTRSNLIGSVYGSISEDLKLEKQGAADIAITAFLAIFAIIFHYAQNKEIERIDVSQQTTQDYSVVIINPPSNILDPKDYFDHFSKFGDVAFITVAVKNGKFMELLVQRKMLINNHDGIEVEKRTDEFIPRWLTYFRSIGIFPSQEKLKQRILDLENKILELAKKKYQPWQVFITFNTEAAQRDCLNKLAIGTIAEDIENSADNTAFGKLGEKRMVVRESPEPSDVIYQYSDRTKLQRFQSFLLSYIVCTGLLFAAYFVVQAAYRRNRVLGTIVITIVNGALPITIKIITLRLEFHIRESDFQISILTKLLVARCVNSALFLFIRTRRADMFSATNLLSIQYILMADAFITPLIRYLNLWDIFQRYSAIKLFHTQTGVNAKWQGAQWTLAERYTDCLKTVYTGLFYAVPLPTGLYFVAFAMMTTYFVDKYSLFRLWRRKAAIDASLGTISKNFFAFSVVSHVATSYYFFGFWPFCENSTQTHDQKIIEKIYEISLIVLSGIFIFGCIFKIYRKLIKIFVGYTKEIGDASETEWRNVKGADIFLPSISHLALAAPVLVSDIDSLPIAYSPTFRSRGWEEVINPRGTAALDEFPRLHELTQEQLQNCFGKTQYFPAKSKDNTDQSKIFEEDEVNFSDLDDELPDYSDLEPDIAELDITVGEFKASKLEKQLTTDLELRRFGDNRVFYYEPSTTRILKRTTTKTGSLGSSKKLSSMVMRQSTGFSLGKGKSQLFTSSLSLQGKQLPVGWEMSFTPEGDPYYVNHITKQTMWELPTDLNTIQIDV